MGRSIAWRAPTCVGAIALFATTLACDRLERETVDRAAPHDESTWTSNEDCEELLAERSLGARGPRIATWNIRYFPDSQEQTPAEEGAGTDVQWLACAIASLDVDVLAIQEFKTTDASLQKQQELVARLNELTSGDWQIQVAPCEPEEVQHPGFLYDATRVTGTNFREIPILNPDPVCSNEASPGFAGYFAINGGPDFHFVSVHLQAGEADTSIERRDYSLSTIEQVSAEAFSLVPDSDIIFAGDFNTSGCTNCSPAISNQEEVSELAETVASFTPPFTLIEASESCSRQVDDNPPLIDLFVVAQSQTEVPAASVAHVSGICEEVSCDRLREWLEDAREHLSDHCPVLLELAARDED